jgi:CheY-like chemotaxis protein
MVINQNIDNELIKINEIPKKILIAEDDKINIFLMERLLLPLKFELVLAQNGKEAVEKFQQEIFDLILMDLYMPVMDGFEATKKIRALANTPPIIVISAARLDEALLKQEIGNDYFMSKPLEVIKFKILLNKIFNL